MPRSKKLRLDRMAAATLVASLSAAFAANAGTRDMPAQALSRSLDQLSREAGVNVLYADGLVSNRRAPAAHRSADPAVVLTELLADSGLTFRRLQPKTFIIVATHPATIITPPVDPPTQVAELLVIGARSVNADLRRNIDDIQPYRVFDSEVIETSQSATTDEFLKERLTENTQALANTQTPRAAGGSARSQVDLRGLGTAQTLILIDGRRLPRMATVGDFLQPDVNGLSIGAVDRIETIGTTASGIFGIGATGGAVNIVTRNDFGGSDLTARYGVTDQGDGAHRALEGHIGLTSPSASTRLSIQFSEARDDGLTFGDRGYIEDARRLRLQRSPALSYLPVSASVNIFSTTSQPLTLIPSLGGASLGSGSTFLPLTASALSAGGVATLLQNAGRVDLTPAPDGQGVDQSLVTPITTSSMLVRLRQDVGAHVVLFADYLRLQDEGRATVPGIDTILTQLAVGQSGNPFQQPILVTYPTPGLLGESRERSVTDRLTVGAIVNLGHGWSANLDAATGSARFRQTVSYAAVRATALNPFQGAGGLASQLAGVQSSPRDISFATNRMTDINGRIAGPLFRLPGGPLSLTVTAEYRREQSPGETETVTAFGTSPNFTVVNAGQKEAVGSLYAEARAPLVADDSALALLRGLELQAAVRDDGYVLTVPNSSRALTESGLYGLEITSRRNIVAYTLGARVAPIDGVLLRVSFADGYTPPTPTQITPNAFNTFNFIINDPKRGGTQPLTTDMVLVVDNGSPSLAPEHGRTVTFGVVFRPTSLPGLRVSVDYSRLRVDHQITDFANSSIQYFVSHEDTLPGHIHRAAVTPADAARGFTVGRIVSVDAGLLTTGQSTLQTVDLAADYLVSTHIGQFHVYAEGTWEPTLLIQGDPAAVAYNAVDHVNGPVSLRANIGGNWTSGPWRAGLSAQTYGPYRATYAFAATGVLAPSFAAINAQTLVNQGGDRIRAQAYVDGFLEYHLAVPSAGGPAIQMTYRLGVRNMFATPAPLIVPAFTYDENAYSPLGDPRGRRFELALSVRY